MPCMVTKIKYSPILNSTVMTRAKQKQKQKQKQKNPPKQPQTRQSNQTLGNLYNVRQQHNVKQTMIHSP